VVEATADVMGADMHSRFVIGGVRFFAVAWIAALPLLLTAPISIVRVLCMIALAGATTGLLLHLSVLWASDRAAFDALRARPAEIARQARRAALESWAAVRGAAAAISLVRGNATK